MSIKCPAVLISAPASGQGKTTLTAALARHVRRKGKRVRVFKTGPDFLDPMIHEHASGAPVYQLDLFMGGEQHCQALLAEAAKEADLILVEGVMGLFDGEPSSADLAERFGLPVLAVIHAGSMAQTFGAIAHGLKHFRPTLPFAGVIANGIASKGHADMLFDALPAETPALGWMPRDADIALPERHLGLLPASELSDLDKKLERAADALKLNPDFEWPSIHFEDAPQHHTSAEQGPLNGKTIAIARDEAFCFIYPANIDALKSLGAMVVFFSPLHDKALPDCDAIWLPGGYPELHAAGFEDNPCMRHALIAHHEAGKPILAECGGMMSLFEQITLSDESLHAGFGLLPGITQMQTRLAALGLQEVTLPEGTLRGHSFHYSTCVTPLEPIARGANPNKGSTAEAVYREGRITASYIHLYFPSNPDAVAALFLP